jgi:acid phosphatase
MYWNLYVFHFAFFHSINHTSAHDTFITPIVAALGLDTPSTPLPNDTIPFPTRWRSANIVPMGGHFVLERLSCNATALSDAGTYVRIVMNEAVVPIQSCQSGPGFSCPLAGYSSIVSKIPNFVQTCKVNASLPQYLDLWWKYNTSNQFNYLNGTIPYQAALVYN